MSAVVTPSPLRLVRSRLHSGNDRAPLLAPKLLEAAENVVEGMLDMFIEWIGETIGQLREQVRIAESPGADHNACLKAQKKLAFEVAGLGGTFGYPLLTVIGTSLVDLVNEREQFTPLLLSTLVVHADALSLVYNKRLKDDGGEAGAMLVANLAKAVERVQAADEKAAAAKAEAGAEVG